MRPTVIILIVAIVLLIIGAIAALLMMMGGNTTTNTLTQNGTKLEFYNNNTQDWTHVEFVILNDTTVNNTTQVYYGEAWIKPGENKTFDLSSLLGYNNRSLPIGSFLRIDTWTGLYNPNTNNSSTGNVNLTVRGWSNGTTPPINDPQYNLTSLNVNIGPLPTNITNTTGSISTSAPNVNTTYTTSFSEMFLTVDDNGNLIITFTTPQNLSETIAELI
jgi:hypothetical protein